MSDLTGLLAATMGGLAQETRLIRLTTPLGGALLAECVRGEESLSGGFTFQIAALAPDAGIALRALIGQPALLELQTAAYGETRAFHGHITAVEITGANGGLARYGLTLAPWTAFLAQNRDSRVFQDKNVFAILDAVFAPWSSQGRLAPAWRFDVADMSRYPVRSLTTQYQESDLAFAERLMREEGLFHYFEHSGDAASPSLGSHTLVIADDNATFKPNAQSVIRFTQPGAVMREDSMDRWRSEHRLRTNAIELQSWDYRTRDTRPVGAAGGNAATPLVSSDVPGAYAYASRRDGQRRAGNQLQALEAASEMYTGAGTVRTLTPGTTFTLTGHAQDDTPFLVTRVVHLMHNNLSADITSGIARQLGSAPLAAALGQELAGNLHRVGRTIAERPLYRNRIDAIRAAVPYRAPALAQPRPVIRGQQTALVVGPAGTVIHTDRDHRIKVQFHWQRGDGGHSRLAHPAPDGHTGAPADDTAGTWVRVATPLAPVAGGNWGSNALPRVGQEVLVDFIDGDIDRPVVIGAVYNGRGRADGQHNDVAHGGGSATGNAPAWFPGTAGDHAHPAVLSGLKSQALAGSQTGGEAFSQLVFDDTPGQSRTALQRHGKAHDGAAELNLGHQAHQADNARQQAAGFGAELKADHHAALRAGKGMLVSADARAGGAGGQMDAREARAQIEQSRALQTSLATTAQAQLAALKTPQGAAEAQPEELPAIAQMASSIRALDGVGSGQGAGDSGGMGSAPAFATAQMQLSAPGGIAATTPANAIVAAGGTSSVTAGQDINVAAQANLHHAVRDGIGLFAYGKAEDAAKPNQETGIRLHAASGKVATQSQAGTTRLTADKAVTVASVAKGVAVTARDHVLLTAQGAFLRLEGGDIMIHGPGTMAFKASAKEFAGPASSKPVLPDLPNEKLYAGRFQLLEAAGGAALAGRLYRKTRADGKVFFGRTSEDGHTTPVNTAAAEQVTITLDQNEKFHRARIDEDDVNDWFNQV